MFFWAVFVFLSHMLSIKLFNPPPSFYTFDVSFIRITMTVLRLLSAHTLSGSNSLFRCFLLNFKFLPMSFGTPCIYKTQNSTSSQVFQKIKQLSPISALKYNIFFYYCKILKNENFQRKENKIYESRSFKITQS